jgi:hypothetical protein
MYQVDAGQQEGLWACSCYWVGDDTRGTASTLGEGLDAIKSRVSDEALQNLPPGTYRSTKLCGHWAVLDLIFSAW